MVECSEMEEPLLKGQIPAKKQQASNPNEPLAGERTETPINIEGQLSSCLSFGMKRARRLMRLAFRTLAELHVQELINEARVLLVKHPIAAAVIAVMVFACGIPILIFVAFAIITITFTLGGFLIIEGAVLAAGSFALLLCLSSMAVVFIVIAFICTLLYITYMQIESMMRTNSAGGENMHPYSTQLPQVLASLRHLPSSKRHRHARVVLGTAPSHTLNEHSPSHHSKC